MKRIEWLEEHISMLHTNKEQFNSSRIYLNSNKNDTNSTYLIRTVTSPFITVTVGEFLYYMSEFHNELLFELMI